MVLSWLRRWFNLPSRAARRGRRAAPRRRGPRASFERLEERLTPATHTWTGAGPDALWSDASNWSGGAPGASETNVVLNFPQSAAQKANQDDIAGLAVQQLNFSGAGYALSGGLPLTLAGGISDTTSASTPGAVNTVGMDLHLANTVTMQVADPSRAVRLLGVISDGAIVTVPASSADLVVTNTGPASAPAGPLLTYTVAVSNSGPNAAQNVILSDVVPSGTAFNSAMQTGGPGFSCNTPSPGNGVNTLLCTAASLAPGSSATFQFVLDAASGGVSYTDTASAVSGISDPNLANNAASAATTVTPTADLAVVQSAPGVTAGTDATYTLTVSNGGPSDAQGVTLTDSVPAGTTFVSVTQTAGPAFTCATPPGGGTGTVTCASAVLSATQSATFQLVVHVPSNSTGPTVTNTAQVAAATADGNLVNNSSSTTARVQTASGAGLSITGPPSVVAGTDATYTITVENPAGPSDALNLTLTDAAPAGTTFVSGAQLSGPDFSCTDAGSLTCTRSDLPAGTTATFQAVLHVLSDDADGLNFFNVTDLQFGNPPPINAGTLSTVATQADVGVAKVGPSAVSAGNNASYTITVSNAGPSDAQNVSLTDAVPAGTTFVSEMHPANWACTDPAPGPSSTTPLTCTLATLPAGQSATFGVVLQVSPTAAGGTVIDNTATVGSRTNDTNPQNNSSTTSLVVPVPLANLAVTKTGPASVTPRSNATYTITLTNSGPDDAQNVTLTDTVPNGTSFVSVAQTGGPTFTCTPALSQPTVTCSAGTFAAGLTATFELVVFVSPNLPPNAVVTNTAAVTSTTQDPNPGNDSATVDSPNSFGVLVVDGTSANDQLVVVPSAPDSGFYILNGGSPVNFSGISQFVFNGNGGNDTFSIDNSQAGTLLAPSGGIQFNNSSGSQDTLQDLGGSAVNGFFLPGATADAGRLVEATDTGVRQVIDGTGLLHVVDTLADPRFTFVGPAGNVPVNVVDGPVFSGTQTTEVNSTGSPAVDFANKTAFHVATAPANQVLVDTTTPAAGLASLAVDGHGNIDVVVHATPAGVPVAINGNGDNDTVNVECTNSPVTVNGGGGLLDVTVSKNGSVQLIQGTVNIENPQGSTSITVDDSGDSAGRTTLLDSLSPNPADSEGNTDVYGTITGLAPAAINYEYADTTSLVIDGCGCGNTYDIHSTGAAATTISAGTGDDTVNVLGSGLGAGTALTLNGQAGTDVFSVTGPTTSTATVVIDGGPTTTAPVDALTYDAGGSDAILDTGSAAPSGDVTQPGGGDVQFTNLATVNLANVQGLTVNDTTAADRLTVNATAPDSGSLQAVAGTAAGPVVGFSGITSFTANGQPGNDTFTINNPTSNGLFAPTGGIAFHGGGSGTLQDLGGLATAGTYAPSGPGAGTLTHVGGAPTQTIAFTGLSPVLDTVAEPNFTVNGTAGNDTISIIPGGPPLSVMSTRVDFNGALEAVTFANKTNVTVNGLGGHDTINVDDPSAVTGLGTGLATLTVTGGTGADEFNVQAVPTGVPVTLLGGSGSDTFNVTPSPRTGGNGNDTFNVTPITVEGALPASPATPSNLLDVNLTGTTSPSLNFSTTPTGASGNYSFGNAEPIIFQGIQTLAPGLDLAITQADSAGGTVVPGSTITYTIVATNNGPFAVNGVTITDTFPAAIDTATWTCTATAGSSCAHPSGSGNISETATLAVGGSATFVVTAHVAASAVGNLVNTAVVAPPPGVGDTNPTNNSATGIDALTPQADLVLNLLVPVSAGAAPAGGFSLLLSNAGPNDAQGVTFTDALPAGATFVSLTSMSVIFLNTPPPFNTTSPFTCTTPAPGSGGTVTCTAPTLTAGAAVSFLLSVQAAGSAAGNPDAAAVVSSTTDPNFANNLVAGTASSGVVMLPTPSVAGLTKTGAGTLELDGNNTYHGPTTVSGGLLLVDGMQPNSAVLVNGGTLGGHGTVGSTTVTAGTISPEDTAAGAPSRLTVNGNFTLGPGGTFVPRIVNDTPGSGYSQLRVTGTISLAGTVDVGAGIALGDTTGFTVIDNVGGHPVQGNFSNHGEGGLFPGSGICVHVTYKGDTGGNVVLQGKGDDYLFVRGIYFGLNIPDDETAVDRFVSEIPARGRAAVAAEIWNSPQHRAAEVGLFYTNFGEPTNDGQAPKLLAALLAPNGNEGDVLIRFLTSKPFLANHRNKKAYVGLILQVLTGSTPGRKAIKAAVGMLGQGRAGRALWVQSVLSSPAVYREALREHLETFLGLTPTPANMNFFIGKLSSGERAPVDLLVDVTTGSPSAARPTPVDFATTYRDYLRAHCEQISAPVGP